MAISIEVPFVVVMGQVGPCIRCGNQIPSHGKGHVFCGMGRRNVCGSGDVASS